MSADEDEVGAFKDDEERPSRRRRRADSGDEGSAGSDDGSDGYSDEEGPDLAAMVEDQYGRCSKEKCQMLREDMVDTLYQLQATRDGDGGASDEVRRLKRENATLTEKLKKVSRERKSVTKNFANLKRDHQDLREKYKENDADLEAMRSRVQELERNLFEANLQIKEARHSRRQRSKDKHRIGDYIEENLALQEKLTTATNRATMFTEALEKFEKRETQLQQTIEELMKRLNESEQDVAKLKEEEAIASQALEEEEEESERLEGEIAKLQAQLAAKDEERDAAVEAVQEEVTKREATITKLHAEIERMRDQTAVRELHTQLEEQKDATEELRLALAEAGQQQNRYRHRVEALTEKLDNLDNEWEQQISEQMELKDLEIKKLERELAGKERQLLKADNRVENVLAQKRSVDEQLVNLREHMDEVERAKNMRGVTARFKIMLAKISQLEQDRHKARLELANRTLDLNVMHEIARRLAVEAGKDEDVDLTTIYPELDIQRSIRGAVGAWKARCEVLEQQNEELEDERLVLLKKARDRAQLMSKGLDFKGLNAEQALKVNEYVRSLRAGRDEKPKDKRNAELVKTVQRLEAGLAAKDLEIASLRANKGSGRRAPRVRREGSDDGGSDDLGVEPTPLPELGMDGAAPGSSEVATSQVIESMQRMMVDLKKEYARKMEAMSKQHAEAIKKALKSRPAAMAPASPRVSRVQKQQDADLQRAVAEMRRDGGVSEAALNSMVETTKQLQQETAALREEVAAKHAAYEEAHGEAQRLTGMEQELRQQVQNLQARATRAEAESMSKSRTITQLEDQIKHMGSNRGGGGGGRGHPSTPTKRRLSGGSGGNGMRVPMSPAGKRVHRSSVASMALPGEAWVDEVNSMNAQLIECLEELARKDDELKRTERSLQSAEGNLGSMAAQQAVLYRDHINAFDKWVKRTKELRGRMEEEQARTADLKAKADRLDDLTSVLEETDEGVLRDKIRVLTRDVALFESTQPALVRKYNLALEEANLARKEAAAVRNEFIDMQKTYQWRILYLELWKSGAEERLDRLTHIAETWVPEYDFKRVNQQLARLRKEYNELLAAETALRSAFVEVRSAPRAKIALEAELEVAKVELEQAHRERQAAVTELAALREDLQARVAASQDDASLQAQLDNVVAQCAQYRGDATRVEIMKDTAERKLAARVKEVKELRAALEAEVGRAAKAADLADKAKAERSAALEQLAQLQTDMAGGLTQAAAQELQDRVTELESMYKGVTREVHRLKEDAHIAHSQAAMLSAAQKRSKDEVEELRVANRLLSSKGDDEAIIGSLQHKYLSLKNEYHRFAVEYERMREDHSVAKHKEQVLQMAVDEAAAKLHKVRETMRVRELAVTRAMEEVRSQRAGGLTVEETRALSIQLIKLEKTSEAQAKELDMAAAMRKAADTRAAAKELEVAKLKEQLEDFKAAAANQGGDFATMIRRLAELSEQLKISQLKELRQGRELASLREEKRTFEGRRRKDEQKMRELDNRIVTAENSLRLKQDAHHQQVQRLKAQLQEARDNAANAADGMATGGDAEGGDMIVATPRAKRGAVRGGVEPSVSETELRTRLDAALEQLRNDGKTLRERAEKIAELEMKLEEAAEDTKAVERRCGKLVRMGKQLVRQLRRNGIDVTTDTSPLRRARSGSNASSRRRRTRSQAEDEGEGGSGSGDDELDDDLASLLSDDSGDEEEGSMDGDNVRGGRGRYEREGLAARRARDKQRKLAVKAKALKEENEDLRTVAREKIASLQAVVAKKQAIVVAYQERLERARAERDAERQHEAVEREQLVEQAYEENKNIIRKLRDAVEQLQGAPLTLTGGDRRHEAVAQEMLERQEQLQTELVDKERQLYKAQQRAALLEQALAQEKNRTGEALLAAEQARDKAALLEAQAKAPVKKERSTAGLVKTLKKHLALREREIRRMNKQVESLKVEYAKASAQLKEDFDKKAQVMKATQAMARGGAGAGDDDDGAGAGGGGMSSHGRSPDEAVMKRVESLGAQVTQLHRRLQGATKRLAAAQEKEVAARRAQQSMARELERALKQARQHETAAQESASKLARARRQLDDARSKLRKLRDAQAEAGAGGAGAGAAAAHARDAQVQQLERQVKLLEAQNAAYKAGETERRMRASRDTVVSDSGKKKRGAASRTGGRSAEPVPPSEAMKKLQRKVEWSVRALSDKNRELQTMRGEVESLRSEVKAAKTDAARARQRARVSTQREDNNGSRALAVLRDLAPSHRLREQVAELEEANALLAERVATEVDGKVRTLEARVQALEGQLKAAQDAQSAALDRVRELEGLRDGGGDAARWRQSEDRALAEASLRDQLAETRKRLSQVEADLVTNQAGAIELQFENTRLAQEVDRLKRRVRELASIKEVLAQVTGVDTSARGRRPSVSSTSAGGGKRRGGASQRRVQELEAVVQELTKVAERRAAEADRLRKLRASDRRSAPEEVRVARKEAADAKSQLEESTNRVKELEREVAVLQTDVRRARAAGKKKRQGDSTGEDRSGATTQAEDVRRLRAALNAAEEDLANMRAELRAERKKAGGTGSGGGDSNSGEVATLRAKVAQLESLNAALRKELSHFDLDFFNEVEDLKFNYERIKSLYEQHVGRPVVL